MPTARQGVRADAVDGIIYAIGGCEVAPGVDRDVSTVEAYDPATDIWTRKADMPTARTSPGIAVVDGRIYVIGGVRNTKILSAVEAYDPATETWTKKADMPTARSHIGVCVVDGRIYVSGGLTKWGLPTGNLGNVPTVEVYDPSTDTWTQASDMPRNRSGHSASMVAGKMYIIGGGEPPLPLPDTVDVYDPTTDTWTMAANFPTPRGTHAAAVMDGRIYVIGGNRSPAAPPLPIVEEYDPGLPDNISSVRPAGKLMTTWGKVRAASP
jgi:N-acetylneuraminic acid mutarotase